MKQTSQHSIFSAQPGKKAWRSVVILLPLLVLSACATTSQLQTQGDNASLAAIYPMLEQAKVRDARFQRIEGLDFHSVDLQLRQRAADYKDLEGIATKKAFIDDFLAASVDADLEAVRLGLRRLSDAQLSTFRQGYLPDISQNADIYPAYVRQARAAQARESKNLHFLPTELEVDAYWQGLTNSFEESILTRGRLMRQVLTAPAVPFVKGWIAYHEATDSRGPMTVDFEESEVYRLAMQQSPPMGFNGEDWALLMRHAPNIVHEINPSADYSVRDDRFGEVSIKGQSLADAMPRVDTRRPTVYAYVDRKEIQGVAVRQLVYTLWHPRHPKLSSFDPEAGILDGWTIRITLGANDQVLDFESISNCGCYYKNFPTTALESRARRVFASALQTKQFHIENTVSGKYDAIVPEVVAGMDDARPNDAWLYFSAGHHQLVTIRSSRHAEPLKRVSATREYVLQPYAQLEDLPFNGYRASLFDPTGLVRQAHRPECTMLTPSGLYHAGHARQRGTQMIYFDEAVFDAPDLLETYLRLPPDAFGNPQSRGDGKAYGAAETHRSGS